MREIPASEVAAGVAEVLLAPLGDRWSHTSSVAAKAKELAKTVSVNDRELLVVSAWWHDLGYAPQLARTGFHPLDGARFLADGGYPTRLCALVAHHSAAMFEAKERGLSEQLAPWMQEEGAVADALWMADMTTGPNGEPKSYPDRLTEILERYGRDSIVGRAMLNARPVVETAIGRTEFRLAEAC